MENYKSKIVTAEAAVAAAVKTATGSIMDSAADSRNFLIRHLLQEKVI